MRDCGGCTLCCRYMKVPETNSPEYEYCGHCTPGVGCQVWEVRPDICRSFGCLWYNQEQIPESLRPDKLGICFELPPLSRVMCGYLSPDRPDAWKTRKARTMIYKIMQAGHPVVLTRGPGTANIIFAIEGWEATTIMNELYISHNKCRTIENGCS